MYELTEQEEYLRATEDSAARYELIKVEHKALKIAHESAKTVIQDQGEALRLSGVQNKLQEQEFKEKYEQFKDRSKRRQRFFFGFGLAIGAAGTIALFALK